jgi:manganese/zinc/iron transport system permease protein
MITGSRDPLVLVIGAALAGWFATLTIMGITNTTRIKPDASLALSLSVFFGVGMMLLTFIQRRPEAAQAGLERFLWGQAAALIWPDVRTMAIIGVLAFILLFLFWNQFKLVVFDRAFASSIGLPVRYIDIGLTSLIVIAIVIGLQTVGVVLMSAMVVAPGAAARQWSDRLARVTLLAGGFGALAGVSGALMSANVTQLPTGPTIVLCLTIIVTVSLLLAPNRGLVWGWVRQHRQSRDVRARVVLGDLYALAGQHSRPDEHGHSIAALRAMSGGRVAIDHGLEDLEQRGLVRQTTEQNWALTERGLREAERQSQQHEENR